MKFERGKLCIGSARLGWKLGFGNGRKDTEIKYISDCDMPLFTPAPDGGIWQNGTGLAVKVTYAEIDGILQGSICFTGNDGINTPVEEVIFPCAEMDFDETVKILTPTSQGRILKNLTGQWDAGLLEYSGGRYRSFRFTAAFSDRCGIYFDCRDSSFYNKSYSWRKEGGKLVYSHIHYPALDGKGEFTLPYRCGVTAFSGGWFEAAMIYRKWAVEQVWFKNALREKNPLKDISMWLWNRGRIDYVLPPAEKLAEDAKVPIALDWYWWHHNPYDTDYPDFWPPPEVDSALVSFKLRSEPLCDIDTAVTVSWLVRTLFNQRRKQMGKVLGNMIGKEVAAAAMAEVALPLEVRPDKLPVAKFVELAHAVMPYLDNSQK